ncbi:MAG: FAD/NAD(P)-binding protein [Coriobacteriia bacterium]
MTDVARAYPAADHEHGSLFVPREATILHASRPTATEKHFTLRFDDGKGLDFMPGQILEVGVMGYGEIPVGIASSPTRPYTFDILVRTVGRVSTAINELNVGDTMHVRGPLGHGFETDALHGHDVMILSGGIGLAPTRSLIQYILDKRGEFGRFVLLYGARDPLQLLFPADRAEWRASHAIEYHETVDRADISWTGNVGVITTLIPKVKVTPDTRVIICGPPVMFQFVIRELNALGIPRENIFVDLERRMKCGVGKCGHCQINDKYCCIDGPVFTLSEIQALEEAL